MSEGPPSPVSESKSDKDINAKIEKMNTDAGDGRAISNDIQAIIQKLMNTNNYLKRTQKMQEETMRAQDAQIEFLMAQSAEAKRSYANLKTDLQSRDEEIAEMRRQIAVILAERDSAKQALFIKRRALLDEILTMLFWGVCALFLPQIMTRDDTARQAAIAHNQKILSTLHTAIDCHQVTLRTFNTIVVDLLAAEKPTLCRWSTGQIATASDVAATLKIAISTERDTVERTIETYLAVQAENQGSKMLMDALEYANTRLHFLRIADDICKDYRILKRFVLATNNSIRDSGNKAAHPQGVIALGDGILDGLSMEHNDISTREEESLKELVRSIKSNEALAKTYNPYMPPISEPSRPSSRQSYLSSGKGQIGNESSAASYSGGTIVSTSSTSGTTPVSPASGLALRPASGTKPASASPASASPASGLAAMPGSASSASVSAAPSGLAQPK